MNLKRLALLLLFPVLFSCDNPNGQDTTTPSSDTEKTAPEVSFIKLGFDDRTHALFTNYDNTVYLNFLITLKDPDRYLDVDKITIVDPEGTRWTREKDGLTWSDSRKRFEFWSYYSNKQKHSVLLGDYKVIVSQTGYDDHEFTFNAFNNNDPSQNTGCVYSHAVPSTPKFVVAPVNLTISKQPSSTKLEIKADSVSDAYYGLFIWLYDQNGNSIGGYDVAWPFESDQYTNMELEQELTDDQFSNVKSVVVGLLAEKKLPEVSTTIMMYRYLQRFPL